MPRLSLLLLLTALFWPLAAAAQTPTPEPSATPVKFLPPELLAPTTPVYPPSLEAQELEAVVRLAVDVDEQGCVMAVTVAAVEPMGKDDSAGKLFANAALRAALRLKFKPATANDKPVPVRVDYSFRFEFTAPEPTPTPTPDPSASPPAEPTYEVEITVLEKGTRSKIAGAEIAVTRAPGEGADSSEVIASGVTDDNAQLILQLPAGTLDLALQAVGYPPSQTALEVKKGERTTITWRIEPTPAGDTVYVRGRREKVEVSRVTLRGEEVQRIPGTLGEPFRVVQVLPGVARAPFLSGQLIVRGAEPDGTAFLINGHPVPILYHFGAGPQVIPAGFVESLDFYAGGAPSRFGFFTAGLVDVDLKRTKTDRWHGHVDIDLVDAGLWATVPIGERGGVGFGLRRSYVDAILATAENAIGATVLPRYWDYQAKADYRFDNGLVADVIIFGSDDSLVFDASPNSEDDPSGNTRFDGGLGFHRGIARAKVPLPEPLGLEMSTSFGRDSLGFSVGDLSIDAALWATLTRIDAEAKVLDNLKLGFGLNTLWAIFEGDLTAPPITLNSFPQPERQSAPPATFADKIKYNIDGRQSWHALYLEAQYKPIDNVLLVPSMRLNLLEYGDTLRAALDPRFSARWRIHEDFTLKGAVGRFHQTPDFMETNPDIGNTFLKPIDAIQSMIGFEWWLWEHIDLDVQLFFNRTWHLPVRSEDIVVRDGQITRQNYRSVGEGRAFGMELKLRHRMRYGFLGWISYTVSRAERRAPGTDWQLFRFDQTHILNLAASYTFLKYYTLGLRWRIVSGNPTTAVNGEYFDGDGGFHLPINGPSFGDRLRLFNQLDVRFDRRFVFNDWIFSLYLEILNVLNWENTEFRDFSYDFRQSGPIQGIPIFPSLGVEADF